MRRHVIRQQVIGAEETPKMASLTANDDQVSLLTLHVFLFQNYRLIRMYMKNAIFGLNLPKSVLKSVQ